MFGGASKEMLDENSLFDPNTYGASKVFAHDISKIYRESYDVFGVNGILFNHALRGETLLLENF